MEQNKKNDLERIGIKQVPIDLPSNSHKSKIEEKDTNTKKRLEKVVTGKVRTQKKSLGKRFSEIIFGKDIESVGSYLVKDVILPSTKSTISDLVTYGIDMLLYGEVRSSSRGGRSNKGNGSYVSYQKFYDDRDGRSRNSRENERITPKFDAIVVETRGEAERVIGSLVDFTIEYGAATIADLYDLVDITSTNFTDNKYGWTNLSTATTRRIRDGYLIVLPRPVMLD